MGLQYTVTVTQEEAANRLKDQIVLPALRLLLERLKTRGDDQ
jgi:hypothetical protein